MGRMGRKQAIAELVAMKKQIERIITELSGDEEHREFVTRLQAGEAPAARSLRDYDMPCPDADTVAERWGVKLEDEGGKVPDWFRARHGHHLSE